MCRKQLPFLTRARLVCGLSLGLIGAALSGQDLPGGVAAPFYRAQVAGGLSPTAVPLPSGTGLSLLTVYRGGGTEEHLLWSLSDADTTRELLTDRQLVDLTVGSYLRLPHSDACTVPRLRTFLRSEGKTGAARSGRLHVQAAADVPLLPVEGRPGQLLDLVAYGRELLPAEQQRIESALALRYGITLDQQEPRHYLAANGSVVWDASLARSEPYRIFGLAHDPEGGLGIYRAASSDCTGEILEVATDSSQSADFYLLLSDDNGAPAVIGDRLQRRWRLQTSGQLPDTVRLQLQPRELHTLLPPDNAWEMWVDTSGRGTFDAPIRVAADGGTFLLPPRTGAGHITFAPREPVDTPPAERFLAVSLTPNPAPGGRFSLRVLLDVAGPLDVTAYDAAGRHCASFTRPASASHLLRGELPGRGVYFLDIRSGAERIRRKITAL